jgi:FkbM family methyltransferase
MLAVAKALVRAPLSRLGLEIKRQRADSFRYLQERIQFRSVLDIGANAGDFAVKARALAPAARIYSFEPLEGAFARLQERMKGDARFSAFQIALGDRDGETEIHRDAFSPASSILRVTETSKKLFPVTGNVTTLRVPIRTLDGWMEEHPLEGPVLVKLDVQGFEDKVLEGGRDCLKRADALITEACFVELYEGQPLFCDLNRLLEREGFRLQGVVEEANDPVTGLAVYADAFYLRQGT